MLRKKIIITAPDIYAEKFETILSSLHFKIFRFPVIETTAFNNPKFQTFFNQVDTFNYIILPSRNAIKNFITQAKHYNIPQKDLQTLNYAVIGKDVEYLNRFGLKSNLITEEASTTGIYKALKKIKNIQKLAVLVPKVEIIKEPDIIPEFIKQLKSIAELKVINAYITRPNINPHLKMIQKIKNSDYDLIAFTSGGEIEALKYLLNNKKAFSNLQVACFGPYTASTALKAGLKPEIIGTDFSSFDGFKDALEKYFQYK